jgi:hypothetical protein
MTVDASTAMGDVTTVAEGSDATRVREGPLERSDVVPEIGACAGITF